MQVTPPQFASLSPDGTWLVSSPGPTANPVPIGRERPLDFPQYTPVILPPPKLRKRDKAACWAVVGACAATNYLLFAPVALVGAAVATPFTALLTDSTAEMWARVRNGLRSYVLSDGVYIGFFRRPIPLDQRFDSVLRCIPRGDGEPEVKTGLEDGLQG